MTILSIDVITRTKFSCIVYKHVSSMSSWSNDETMTFLEAYQNEPCIWNPKDINHKDKKKVTDAWSQLSHVLKKPVRELKIKKEILMTTFRKHFKRKQESIRSGAEHIYKPCWFAYEYMESFLLPVYTCNYTSNTETTQLGHPRKKKKSGDIVQQLMELHCKCRNKPDYHDTIAGAWSAELSKMEPAQQILAKKFINDILFEGQMGTLHRDSVVINSSLRTSSPYSVQSPPSFSKQEPDVCVQNKRSNFDNY